MKGTEADSPSSRLFRLMSIAGKPGDASGLAVTFEDEAGRLFETTATVSEHGGMWSVSFDPDVVCHWNGAAESVRRIVRVVLDFHAAHTRAAPDE